MHFEQALQRYLRHHKAANHSPSTVAWHFNSINPFIAFLGHHGYSTDVGSLEVDTVRAWLDEQHNRGLSVATLNARVRSLKAFTRWLVEEETLAKDPLRKLAVPKVGDIEKPTLSPQDVDKLLATCDRRMLVGARDYPIMMLLFSTGLRAAEIMALKTSDIDWNMGLLIIRKGKGKKSRVVPLGEKADRALMRYVNHPKRPADAGDSLFLTDDGRPMGYTALKEMLRRRGKRTGIHANPHKWRHSASIQYLRSGGRIETLRSMLGHSTLDMSLHYARIAGVDLKAAHDTADPTRALKTR